MKNQTKKIVLTQKGEISKNVLNALSHCYGANGKFYVGYYSGNGRFTTAHSSLHVVTQILDAQGYKYTFGNDAPNGGVLGDHVKISKTAMNFLNNLKKGK
jgi:hypothetical protein